MVTAAATGGTEADEDAQHVLEDDDDEVRDDVWSPLTEEDSRGQVLIQHRMLSQTNEQTDTNVTLNQGLMNRKFTA